MSLALRLPDPEEDSEAQDEFGEVFEGAKEVEGWSFISKGWEWGAESKVGKRGYE